MLTFTLIPEVTGYVQVPESGYTVTHPHSIWFYLPEASYAVFELIPVAGETRIGLSGNGADVPSLQVAAADGTIVTAETSMVYLGASTFEYTWFLIEGVPYYIYVYNTTAGYYVPGIDFYGEATLVTRQPSQSSSDWTSYAFYFTYFKMALDALRQAGDNATVEDWGLLKIALDRMKV